jgi:hypothetical protein
MENRTSSTSDADISDIMRKRIIDAWVGRQDGRKSAIQISRETGLAIEVIIRTLSPILKARVGPEVKSYEKKNNT